MNYEPVHRWSAIAPAAVFAVQFLVSRTSGRYILSAVQIAIGVVALVIHSKDILPTSAAPFQQPSKSPRTRPPKRLSPTFLPPQAKAAK